MHNCRAPSIHTQQYDLAGAHVLSFGGDDGGEILGRGKVIDDKEFAGREAVVERQAGMSSLPDQPTCLDPGCPLTFLHGPGLYMHDNEAAPHVERLSWGASNPPPWIWAARERLLDPGLGYVDGDMGAVLGFYNCHYAPWVDVDIGLGREVEMMDEAGDQMEIEEDEIDEVEVRMSGVQIDDGYDASMEFEGQSDWGEGQERVAADPPQRFQFFAASHEPIKRIADLRQESRSIRINECPWDEVGQHSFDPLTPSDAFNRRVGNEEPTFLGAGPYLESIPRPMETMDISHDGGLF
ncbi:hypothetical protein Q9189_007547 [Teloschistes chrysophthalmus]